MNEKPLVVITGASAGIGAAAAHRFAKEGCRIVLLARRLDRLEQLQKELPSPAWSYELDVTSSERVADVMAAIEKNQGPIDVLINNAGLAFGLDPAYKCDVKEWDQCVDVNIKGLLHSTHAVLPLMVKRNKGHIINLGSTAGSYPYPGGNVYCGTKAFVHQFSLALRADLLGTKVRVSCIEPGLVGGTEFSVVRFRGDEKRAKSVVENKQALEPDDVAQVIYFCYSLPEHVNLNTVEMMPVSQAFSPLTVHKNS